MKLTTIGILAVVGFAVTGSQASAAGNVPDDSTIHYTFDSDLLDIKNASTLTTASACPVSTGPCNSASSFGEDSNGKYWTWTSTDNRGGGFTIETNAQIGDSYTIALKFSFDQVTSWRKIIDYKNRVSDNGFYYYNSKLQFYPYTNQTSTTTYPAGTVLDLIAVRTAVTASTGTFTVYAVGSDNALTKIFEANDTNNDSLPFKFGTPEKTRLGFFYDDVATSSEATPTGKVYDLRIWAGTSLSATTLSAQVLKPAAPTQVTGTPAAGSVTVSWQSVSGASSYTATAGGQSCTATAPATSCVITGLTDGQQVTPTVQAFSPGGQSPIATATSAVVVGAVATTTIAPTTTTTIAPVSKATKTAQLPAAGGETQLAIYAVLLSLAGVALRKRVARSR